MIVLDCESTDSIYASLEVIAGAKRDAIESFLKTVDLNPGGTWPPPHPGNDFLLDKFKRTFRTRLAYDATYWFHLTRTTESTSFDQGILPLGHRLDLVFDWLYQLFDGVVSLQRWAEFRAKFKQEISRNGPNVYREGPFAMLVRDLAFRPEEVGNHDYFSKPEIIEDICDCFEKLYNLAVFKIFVEKTKPCIVKFIDSGTRIHSVRAALWHLYAITREEKCTDSCKDNFDGRGTPVRKEQIRSIEFPEYVVGKAPSESEHSKPLMPVTIIAPDPDA